MGLYRKPQACQVAMSTLVWGVMAAGALPPALPTLAQYGLAASVWADGTAGSSTKTVDIDVVNADIGTVVNLLTRQTGMDIVVQDDGHPFGRVSAYLPHASFDKALRSIATSANATVTRNADGVYVIRSAAGTADSGTANSGSANSAAADENAPNSTRDASYNSETQDQPDPTTQQHVNMTWHKLVLQHAVPSEVLKIMHWDRDLRTIDPYGGEENLLKPTITTTGGIVNTMPFGSSPSVPIGRGGDNSADQANRSYDPSQQAQQAPVVFGGNGGGTAPGFNPGGFQNGGFNPGGGGFQNGGGGFNPGGFQNGGGGGFNPGGFQNGGGRGGNQANQQQLPDGVSRIYALEGDNSLFVEATPDGFNQVRDIVKNLDIAPRQVQIKVEFVTASVTDVDTFGINFSLVPFPNIAISNNNGDAANTSSVPQTFVQVASGNIVAQLYASLVNDHGKVVESPLVTTTNNVQAYINVAEQIPYVTTTNIVQGTGNTVSNTQQNFIQTNTGLQVTPRINSDDTVTLRLSPVITDVSGAPAISGGPPPLTQQSLQTLRTVRSGETMVLGGFVRKSDTNAQSRIPFLSDLPIIGSLFRNRVKNVDDSELLIFVTPTIISNDTESEATAGGPNVSVAP